MPSAPRRQYLVAFVFVSAEFEMRDGGTFPGYVRAASENWGGAPPVRTRANGSILRLRPLSVRFGGPLAILGIQQPKIFVRGRRFSFGEAFAEYQRKIVPCLYCCRKTSLRGISNTLLRSLEIIYGYIVR
jgi:hypothetical protein